MPPPNITGKLHMGHALFLTIQDSLNRYWKNLKYNSLWLPGLDHAGLATHEKIISFQKESGHSYDDSATYISATHREIILRQIKQLGALPDWDKLSYTLDPEYQKLTLDTLKLLYEDNRISFKEGQFFLDLKDFAEELKKDLENDLFCIIPSYEIKNLLPFLENFEPWCISRQIPWGTSLPLFYEDGKIIFDSSRECGESLDTWFNSSLWTIGCLIKNPELIKDFYPASLIETGADILFFWCARMLIMSSYLYKNQNKMNLKLPEKYAFKTIYLHGIIRDKYGRKFSKSLGNGIDPLDMISKYGADATRLFIISRTGPSEDILFNEELLSSFKKFSNKIWQSARFFSIYAAKSEMEKIKNPDYFIIEKEGRCKLEELQGEFCSHMDNHEFLQASRLIHSAFKEWFCDKWIEENKKYIQGMDKYKINQGILILDQMMAMLEPFCPFICSDIKEKFFIRK